MCSQQEQGEMAIEISEEIEEKLREKHNVSPKEVDECIQNVTGILLKDNRDKHKTNPPTWWIVSETNQRRLLKVCFIIIDNVFHIKTAYEPNEEEKRIYATKYPP